MSSNITTEDMIKAWGSPESYFAELRAFLKKHDRAELRTCDSTTGALISVTYLFMPYLVVKEQRDLIEALRAQDEQEEQP